MSVHIAFIGLGGSGTLGIPEASRSDNIVFVGVDKSRSPVISLRDKDQPVAIEATAENLWLPGLR